MYTNELICLFVVLCGCVCEHVAVLCKAKYQQPKYYLLHGNARTLNN